MTDKADAQKLQENVQAWFEIGEVGVSSETMARVATNQPLEKSHFGNHPHDADDLRRCVLLVDQIPEIRNHFDKIAEVSPIWKQIITNWDKLEASLKSELGPTLDDHRFTGGTVNTYQMLKKLERAAVVDQACEAIADTLKKSEAPKRGISNELHVLAMFQQACAKHGIDGRKAEEAAEEFVSIAVRNGVDIQMPKGTFLKIGFKK